MANLYNLKRFDLNLLIIFECIYQNLSISQAAQTLFITPSAVSQSLQRLRVQLNDPLFIRSGKGITPTTVAVNLHRHLENNLNSIEETLNIMGDSDLKKEFIVYGPQFHTQPKLTQFITTLLTNPNLEVSYHDVAAVKDSVEDILNYRKADIVFTTEKCENRALVCMPFSDCPVTLTCREGHPRLNRNSTLEDILKERFTYIESREMSLTNYKDHFKATPLNDRNIVFRSNSLMSIFNVIHESDLVGFVPKYSFEKLKGTLGLQELRTPMPLPDCTIYMVYSRSSLTSPYFSEVINQIQGADEHSCGEYNVK